MDPLIHPTPSWCSAETPTAGILSHSCIHSQSSPIPSFLCSSPLRPHSVNRDTWNQYLPAPQPCEFYKVLLIVDLLSPSLFLPPLCFSRLCVSCHLLPDSPLHFPSPSLPLLYPVSPSPVPFLSLSATLVWKSQGFVSACQHNTQESRVGGEQEQKKEVLYFRKIRKNWGKVKMEKVGSCQLPIAKEGAWEGIDGML